MVEIGAWLRLSGLLLPRYPNQKMQRDNMKVTMSCVSRFGLSRLDLIFLHPYRNVHNFRCLGEDVLDLLNMILNDND